MKGMNLKRNLFLSGLALVMVCSMGVAVYAAESDYTYPNGYKMNYDLFSIGSSVAGAYTNTSNDAIAFVGIFSYKNGTVKNSATNQSDFYVTLSLGANGGNYYISHHALKYFDNTPVGRSRTLDTREQK